MTDDDPRILRHDTICMLLWNGKLLIAVLYLFCYLARETLTALEILLLHTHESATLELFTALIRSRGLLESEEWKEI
jgi:hypothetical protein